MDGASEAFLWWVGGAIPIADDLRRRAGAHELVPGGSLRCRCGEHHDAPGAGSLVALVDRERGAVEVRVIEGTPAGSVLYGVRDDAALMAVAQHLALGGCDGVFGYSPDDFVELLRREPVLDIGVFQGDTARDALAAAARWVSEREALGHVQFFCQAAPETRLAEINELAMVIGPEADGCIFQLVSSATLPARVSLLAGRRAPEGHATATTSRRDRS